jgi:pyruvyltransferase
LECKIVLSSSLHGLVLADSFQIPNKRIVLSNNIIGGDFKFKDYYSGIDNEYRIPKKVQTLNDMFEASEDVKSAIIYEEQLQRIENSLKYYYEN